MTLGFGGMIGTANLPAPWGVVSSSGIVVRAHGTQTGIDTTSYSVNFSPLVPTLVPITAYLAATITQIQQNPFPLTGPPPGHPSFNPNFKPSTAYATTTYSVALSAVTGVPDNINTFELARTTLIPGQISVSSFSTIGWQRAAQAAAQPATVLNSGGLLTPSQAALMLMPGTAGLTSTLPVAASGGGLTYQLVNPQSTPWTVATSAGNGIIGAGPSVVNSIGVPPNGAVSLWGNAASGLWEIIGTNPLMFASLPNIFTAPQTVAAALTISGTGGAAILRMLGNGTVTPSKTLMVQNGLFNITNDAQSTNILTLNDGGDLSIPGRFFAFTGFTVSGASSVSGGLSVLGGVSSTSLDPGGMNFRTVAGPNTPGAGFRNDGTGFYLLLSSSNNPLGGFNALRPLTVNLANGEVQIDGTGAGTSFNGKALIPNVIGTIGNIGGVDFPGQGQITTNGAIRTTAGLSAAAISTPTGNITAGARLRALFGALGSGDQNAGTILADFPFTDANSGNMEFPNGVIVQWGQVSFTLTGSNAAVLYNFPEAFPHNCYVVVASLGAFGPLVGNCVGAQPANLSQFYVAIAGNVGIGNVDGVYWLAIGH